MTQSRPFGMVFSAAGNDPPRALDSLLELTVPVWEDDGVIIVQNVDVRLSLVVSRHPTQTARQQIFLMRIVYESRYETCLERSVRYLTMESCVIQELQKVKVMLKTAVHMII